jgi:hypothetical protein
LNKAINIETTGKNVTRVLSIADETIIVSNPTGLEYILITDYEEPPTIVNGLSKNYPMYDKVSRKFKWVQVQYQSTATEEMLGIENLNSEVSILKGTSAATVENVNLLIELQADMIGGAV